MKALSSVSLWSAPSVPSQERLRTPSRCIGVAQCVQVPDTCSRGSMQIVRRLLCSQIVLLLRSMLWLSLLCVTVLPFGSAQPDSLAIVKTTAELRDAFKDATPHIELQGHLDMRNERPATEAMDFKFPFMFKGFSAFESLRVRRRLEPVPDIEGSG